MKKTLTLLTGALAATSMTSSAALIAGWDSSWNVSTATQTVGTTGSFSQSGNPWLPEFRASHGDGTFGSQISGADTTFASTAGTGGVNHVYGFRSANMTATTIDFTITDTTGVARQLDWFSFDSVRRTTVGSASYTVSVFSGDLTIGAISGGSGTITNSTAANTLSNYDVSLAGLTDNILDANGTVTFRMVFSATAAGHLELDNVGISAVPEPSSAALLGLAGLALVLRRRK